MSSQENSEYWKMEIIPFLCLFKQNDDVWRPIFPEEHKFLRASLSEVIDIGTSFAELVSEIVGW